MRESYHLRDYRFAILILLLVTLASSSSLKPRFVNAETTYSISISVNPSSGEVGDSFTVRASVTISGLSSGTAYVVMKTVAPDGSYSYYASSAQDVPPYRQWVSNDMPVSMTYTWTVTAEEEGTYTSTIEIIIDGDASGGLLKDSRSAFFEASSGPSQDGGSVNVSVNPSNVKRGESVSISVVTQGFLPPNPRIYTYVYPPGASNPVQTYSGTGTFTYVVPSDGEVGIWRVSSLVKDEFGNVAASDSDSFKVADDTSSSSDSERSSPELWVIATPNPADVGKTVKVTVHYRYPKDKYYYPNPLQIKIGNGEWTNLGGELQFTPTSSGPLTIFVKGYFDSKSLPGHGFGIWVSNSTTIFVRKIVTLLLEYPEKVHVGDSISIKAKLMCGDRELMGKKIRVFVDEEEFLIDSGQTIVIQAERAGTIDVSALFEGDQECSPARNGGGLIEVWTKPLLKVEIGARG